MKLRNVLAIAASSQIDMVAPAILLVLNPVHAETLSSKCGIVDQVLFYCASKTGNAFVTISLLLSLVLVVYLQGRQDNKQAIVITLVMYN